ncbi:MAG: CapA family protein [Spirochaetaceae bacterium]|nr:CapA family protein [Spirochaetaceae bacterium]
MTILNLAAKRRTAAAGAPAAAKLFSARFFSGLILLLALLGVSCATVKKTQPSAAPPPELVLAPPEDYRITMAAVGDNLIHIELIDNARTEAEDVFDFDKYYTRIVPLIKNADIAFINQETMIAGVEFGYSGYPLFNGPKDIGKTILKSGFNVINHATNHTMDKGEEAVFEVMDFWDDQPLVAEKNALVLGINRSPQQRDNVERNIIEKNNIKIGFLAYTYGTNGIPLPKDKPFLVSLTDTALMKKEIDALRPLCDFLVVSMHWGNEYEYTPSNRQEELALFLAECGVDLVIGHHPHVLQPIRAIARENAPPMICFFSLGNFLSAQKEPQRILGGMMRVSIKKEAAPPYRVSIEDAELIPLVAHYENDHKNFSVYPLSDYTEKDAERHFLRQKNKFSGISYFHELLNDVFGQQLKPAPLNFTR